MAGTHETHWEGQPDAASRIGRKGGPYRVYTPDRLTSRPLILDPDVDALAARTETSVRRLVDHPGSRGLEGLSRFLLRSEAIASSRIEGLEVSPQQVGIAELFSIEGLHRKASATARRVAANITAVQQAATTVADMDSITLGAIEAVQRTLLDGEPEAHGVRQTQNWIGGNGYNPVAADFVPPVPDDVPDLMQDLITYLNGGAHAPLVQAGIAHAQFETIHPFPDGNGRVGRAIIHAVLVRRGLTRTAVLPISQVLFTRSRDYVQALTAYRYDGAPTSPQASEGVSQWLRTFLTATHTAVEQAATFAAELENLRTEWTTALAAHRSRKGLRPQPRAGSAAANVLLGLQETPVLTTTTVMDTYGASAPAARDALDELTEAGILTRKKYDQKTNYYLALDVFDLITSVERQLASTQWDTSQQRPSRPVPYRPRS
ncbi:Fic family protein [Kineococcus sp. NBC_00420]|uniref:Fic family protein n=1 Tax=Kineococcus sp. NBC_00420 TaxID=2903564 RepID=UPI002E1CD033